MECILDRAGSHNEIQGKLNTLMFLFIYYTYVMKIEELSYQAEYDKYILLTGITHLLKSNSKFTLFSEDFQFDNLKIILDFTLCPEHNFLYRSMAVTVKIGLDIF